MLGEKQKRSDEQVSLRGADGQAMAVCCDHGNLPTEKIIVRVYQTQEHGQRSLPWNTLLAGTIWHGPRPPDIQRHSYLIRHDVPRSSRLSPGVSRGSGFSLE